MTDSEENLAKQTERLFPHIRKKLYDPDELLVHAQKLYPHIQGEFHKDVGKGVVSEATGMLRKALWAIGSLLLALLAAALAYIKGTGE